MDIPEREWGSTSDDQPYFFLSYAHTPPWGPGGGDPDHWVHVLFRDLCTHIMAITDLPAGSHPGFMDREMRPGDGWPQKLSENLASCRVFVPLFSSRYFTSEMCGRELFAFNERIRQAKDGGAPEALAIVPALWTRVDYARLPDSVRHIHLNESTFPDRYATDGIYGLIKLNRLRDEYEETVLRLAERIVRVAHETALPTGRPRDYESTPSAFRPRGAGPRQIRLTVAAPTRDSIPGHRDPGPYGEDARDWNPYHNETPRALAAIAGDVIRSLDYRVTVASLDDEDTGDEPPPGEEPGEERQEPRPNGPGILLVDRWVLTDEERRRRLKAFDSGARPWVGAVVPWNRADAQCHGDEGRRLTEELERTLPLLLDRGRRADARSAVNGVPTLKSFTEVLPGVVASTTRKYLKHAAAHPPPGPTVPRPRLVGPSQPPYQEGGTDRGGDA
ncbi:TIR-like protein FxsC [Streptomyces sp. NPDC057257]|uniref:TIR-like protein FxsC n=1 Tax=Streptomyces sp. NPDC057257 TaxID=3346071 RepID=UPI0036370E6E